MFAPGWGCLSVLVGYHVGRVVATGSAGRNEFCRIYEFLQLCVKIFVVKCNILVKGEHNELSGNAEFDSSRI